LLLADRLATLYELLFPNEPALLLTERVDWQDEAGLATAVERFLERAGQLFPVHSEIWDEALEEVEWRLYEIPICPAGFDIWYDDNGWEDYQEPIPYLLHQLCSRREVDEETPDLFISLYPQHPLPHQLEPQRLVSRLRQHSLPEPLKALPDLIEMLTSSCDNVWLDVGDNGLADSGGYPRWGRETIDWLTVEWQRAEPVLERVMALLNWQDDTADGRAAKLNAVQRALLAAYQSLPETGTNEEETHDP